MGNAAQNDHGILTDRVVDGIKANVGFQQLQQMRYESPTGGALGQVAVQELNFLQSALGSLDTAQDPTQLVDNLKKVRDHYARFKEYAAQDYEIAQERAQRHLPAEAAAPAAPAAPVAPQPVEARIRAPNTLLRMAKRG